MLEDWNCGRTMNYSENNHEYNYKQQEQNITLMFYLSPQKHCMIFIVPIIYHQSSPSLLFIYWLYNLLSSSDLLLEDRISVWQGTRWRGVTMPWGKPPPLYALRAPVNFPPICPHTLAETNGDKNNNVHIQFTHVYCVLVSHSGKFTKVIIEQL